MTDPALSLYDSAVAQDAELATPLCSEPPPALGSVERCPNCGAVAIAPGEAPAAFVAVRRQLWRARHPGRCGRRP